MSVQTREQKIVAALYQEIGEKQDMSDYKRAQSLPVTLIRHGLLQTSAFLRAKGGVDAEILGWIAAGMRPLLGDLRLEPEVLAKLPLRRYMLAQEVAVEAATWLKRIVEARLPPEEARP